ncbi:lipoprotein [Spiroplasma citri]|uniref:lipoprotein n=1 Tax=Spiroplasma citri TaxID=2133 RepID=UPI00241245CA|nr:lipoprotein [Spiroplasma citri]WFG99073.1 lipoprotein [Spiroplasma citri]
MKKILSILGTMTLIGTSATSLAACNTPQCNEDELLKLKKINKINTANQEIKNNLEWIAPQEKPFNKVDNKYYFVIWYDDINNSWKIIKFLNNNIYKKIYEDNNFVIRKSSKGDIGAGIVLNKIKGGQETGYKIWPDNDYFKGVYLWNNDSKPNKRFISPKTGQITDWNLKQQNNIKIIDKIKVTAKNKDISENKIYQLEANYFNWLSITNEIKTNNIPSLIPAEIKLSDGEYGKYLTNLIVSNNKIEDYLNYFSQWYRLFYSKAVWMSIVKKLVVDKIILK